MRYGFGSKWDITINVAENKEKLNKVFKLLRKNFLIARQDFRCCQSCAGYEIATDVEKMLDNGKRVDGWVFYHHQDTEGALETRNGRPSGELYLAYSSGSTNKYENNGIETVAVGKIVAIALTEVGVPFEWDGNSDSRILVKLNEKVVQKVLVEADSETWGE